METTEVCEIDVATRRIVGGSDSPPDLDSPCQVNTINMFVGCLVFGDVLLLVIDASVKCPIFNVH